MVKERKLYNNHFIIVSLLIIVICFLSPNIAKAYTISANENIYDDAGLLTDEDRTLLIHKIKKVEDKYKINIFILTTSDYSNLSGDNYIDTFIDEGCNKKKFFSEDTVVLLIDLSDNEVCFNYYGKTQKHFNSNRADDLTDSIIPFLKTGNYSGACEKMIHQVDHYMKTDFIYFQVWFQLLVALILGAIVVAILAFSRGSHITTNSHTYMDQNHSKLRAKHDNYIRTSLSKRRKPQNNNSSSGSGGGKSGPSGLSHGSSSKHF